MNESAVRLFPYQQRVIPELLKSLRPDNPTLLVAPTGSGKTVIAGEIAYSFDNVVFTAHRGEIVDQAHAEMRRNAQCMSIHQALHHGPPKTDLLIIDEAHRSTASTYRQIIEKYRGACVLGMTATPRRTDGQGLIDVFSEIVECSSVKDLVDLGHLVPYHALEAPDEALKQLAHMKRTMGDYATRELSALVNKPRLVGDVVHEYKKHGMGRKAVAFAVSVEHSRVMTAAFCAAGVRAVHLDGRAAASVRAGALQDLADGRLDVLCNVNLFTEGWDCPSVSCVIMARPTASLTLYLQCVGRGMRTAPGKTDLLILDHAGNIERHGPPDEKREWSLESEKQKSKREAEYRELEWLYALGYESIEAELEAKRREREEIARDWMTPEELADCLKSYRLRLLVLRGAKEAKNVYKWAHRFRVTARSFLGHRKCFYSRKEAMLLLRSESIEDLSPDWATIEELEDMMEGAGFGSSAGVANLWARWSHVIAIKIAGRKKLYYRRDITAALEKQGKS